MNDVLGWFLDLVHNVDPILRVFIAGLGMLLETSILVGLLVPGDTIVLVASTAVTNPVEYFSLLVAVVVGALAGESIGFALGRYFGPRIRHSRLGQRLGERNWARAEHYLARRGGIAVFVSRFLPVLHALIPLTVGTSEMRYRRFLAWTAPACVIWATAYVSVGSVAAGSFRRLSAELHFAGYIFAAIILAFFVVVIVTQRLLERREQRQLAQSDATQPDATQPDATQPDATHPDSAQAGDDDRTP